VIQECTNEAEVWHDDVRFYKIFNKSGNNFVLWVVLFTLSSQTFFLWTTV